MVVANTMEAAQTNESSQRDNKLLPELTDQSRFVQSINHLHPSESRLICVHPSRAAKPSRAEPN